MKKCSKRLFILLFVFLAIFLFDAKETFASETPGITAGMIYNIKNVNSGKYLNVNLGTDANGTNVIQWSGDGSIEQKFRVVYYSDRDAYRIYPMCSEKGSNRVLDVLRTGGSASGAIENGNNVDIWTTGDDNCQFFSIVDRGNDSYSIHLKSFNALALTACGTGNGSGAGNTSTSNGNVYVSYWLGLNNSQLWKFEPVNATPAYPYKNTRGVVNQTYYVDSTANPYLSHINAAISDWSPTITLSRVYDNSSSSVDFFIKSGRFFMETSGGNTGILGMTQRFTGSTQKSPVYSNWAFSEISINATNLDSPEYNSTHKKAVIVHEIGHAYGLMHLDSPNTIMRPGLYTFSGPFEAQTMDRTAISFKY